VHGFATQFGEPVIARIYYDAAATQPDDIIALIETKSYKLRKGDEIEEVAVDFKCEGDGSLIGTLDRISFIQSFFSGYDQRFNHYGQYEPMQLKIFEIGLPDAESRRVRLDLRYLSSHVSFHDGIVRVRTIWRDRPVLQIYFDPTQVDSAYIHQRLSLPEMEVLGGDGKTFAKENRFEFNGPVLILDND